ncbi:DUF2971 domain-containing protein [Hydrogenophaga sp. 2FB]|uniref:DUF2971 domain-containing protein n=1 Tax=Hydrogenophaga sp. 2FB TaxID=2502187 RepID=UPI00148561E6|nr:DUF2971 domain-containing protein [Hydrogenophaga sp. 2FB]
MIVNVDRMNAIFYPYAWEKFSNIRSHGARFVHYTSAEVAMSILRKGEVWMRSTTLMNDFREVEHGLDCLTNTYKYTDVGKRFQSCLNLISPKLRAAVEESFDAWRPHFQTQTYLTCFSEHRSSEDELGRLSMWRAYGGKTGVAIVVNGGVLARESDALQIYSNPVLYADRENFTKHFASIVDNVNNELEYLREVGSSALQGWIFQMFRTAVLCTKHPGFEEEMEWRVVHSPVLEKSDRLACSVELVGGTPQVIYKIPLKDFPEEGLFGLEIPKFLDRIIIGPTNHPREMAKAFYKLLEEAGVPEPRDKVVMSRIPLRHN